MSCLAGSKGVVGYVVKRMHEKRKKNTKKKEKKRTRVSKTGAIPNTTYLAQLIRPCEQVKTNTTEQGTCSQNAA